MATINEALGFAKRIAYSTEETLEFSYKCANDMRCDGDFVECG